MKLVDRYLGKTILHTIGIVMLALTGFEIFMLLVTELGDIGHGHYTVLSAFVYVLLSLPQQLYNLFPMAGLLGMLMGLGLLANHSELIILQGAGMSPLQIALKTLKTVLLMVIVMTILGELIAPFANQAADNFKDHRIHTNSQSSDLGNDIWLRINNTYLHISRIDQNKVLHGVTWFQFDTNQQLISTNLAASINYHHKQWQAQNIKTTLFKGQSTVVQHQDKMSWPFAITPELLANTIQQPSELSLSELQKSVSYHHQIKNSSNAVQLALWRRIMQPIASLVMMLLAIPFIFGPLRQANQNLRLVAGIGIGFAFYYSNQLFGPLTILLHWPPLVGAVLPTAIFATVGLLLLAKT